MKINIAGNVVEVGDEFAKLPLDQQNQTVDEIAATLGPEKLGGAHSQIPPNVLKRAAGVGVNDVVRSVGEGIPIVGGLLNKVDAATNATLAPVLEQFMQRSPSDISVDEKGIPNASWGERYRRALAMQSKQSETMAQEHPVVDTAAKLAGGAAATLPLAASATAAKALGMSGTLPQMVTRGALSGAGIGAADAAVRGEDPLRGGEIAAVAGAGLPVAGRAIGKAVQAFRGPGPRPGATTVDVNGVEVPQMQSSITGDNAIGSAEQAALSGASGPEAQRIAQDAFDARAAAMAEARTKMGTDLAPQPPPAGGPPQAPGQPPPVPGVVPPAATPHVAGDQVITDLAQQHNDQVQRQAAQSAQATVEGNAVRNDLIPENAPRPPTMPPDAFTASEGVGGEVQAAAQRSATQRNRAYETLGQTEGEFNQAGFRNVGNSMRDRLNAGEPNQRVRVNDTTPNTREGIGLIEENFQPTPLNDAQRGGGMQIGPDGRPIMRPITAMDVEGVRQQLIPLLKQANNAARGPGGSAADARGMRRLIDAFDAHVREVIQAGGFSGDGAAYLQRLDAARAAHSAHRGLFSARGQGDTVGPIVEKIIGKHPGQESDPATIANAIYGSPANPGGGTTVAVAQRVRQIVGPDSPAWTGVRQGFLSHILDVPAGVEPLTAAQQADRIYNAVNSTKGRLLAQVLFSPEERARLLAHADQLRALAPRPGPTNAVDRQVLRLSGADGHPPASTRDAVDALFTGDGTKGSAVQLATRLKQVLQPDTWNSVRQGMWEHLTTKPEGMIEFGPQALSQRLHKFLSEPMAAVLYDSRELQMMKIIADEYKKMIPLANTTNPSGSGVLLSKMGNAAKGNLLPMLGLAAHGVPGVLAGAAGSKALSFISNRRTVSKTMDLFHGKANKGPLNKHYERAAAILAHAATPLTGAQ